MLIGRTMVPLLLLLFLHESLADPVCFNISDFDINITVTHADISDRQRNIVTCQTNGSDCYFQCTFSKVEWSGGSSVCLEAKLTGCDDIVEYKLTNGIMCTQYLCEGTPIVNLIESLDDRSCDQRQLYDMRDSCTTLFRHNHEVKKAFINVERQMIHNIMRTSQVDAGHTINHRLRDLSLNMINISEDALDSRIQIEIPQLLPQNESFIPETWLPLGALQTIPKEERIIGLVSYMQHYQFQFDQEEISSVVIRIELLGERHLRNLNTPIKMIFRVTTASNMDNDSQLLCCYFDEGDWSWKTDGCETYNSTQNNTNYMICYCDHTTPFAVLLMRESIAEVHWKILSYISYIGCGLSAFFTALSLLIYVFSRTHRMDYSISIHVSLSGALLMLNSAFLLTEWGATVKPDWVCVFVAVLIHYSLLSCFTWMAIEAVHLYLLLIKVFNTYYKHYLLKLSLAGWGIPGVIVAVSLGLKDFKQFYGVTQMTMGDTNQTNSICWITDDSFFYSLNLVYFTLIFIFNSGILMAVASSICKMKQVLKRNSKFKAETKGNSWRDAERFSASCRNGLTLLGLTCLMGTTWGLALLGSGYVNYPILYLFCILNSTQGFFIFLWICLSAKKQRKRGMGDTMTSNPVRTSATKSE